MGAIDPTAITVGAWGVILVVIQALGLASAVHALMQVRTAQGTVAWCLALATVPTVALPLYWIFGRNKFSGYLETLRTAVEENQDLVEEVTDAMKPHHGVFHRDQHPVEDALDKLTPRKFCGGNKVDLLIDGENTFAAIYAAIRDAREYLLVQFFIIKDDETGRDFKRRLIAKASEGVRVYLLFDEIGSHKLSKEYLADLRTAGVEVHGFGTHRLPANRFQVNFRNHRKIVIADGRVAFVGGHNVADDYLGKGTRFHRWRDTHIRVEGPSVQGIQASFIEDWYWATRVVPEFDWQPRAASEHGVQVLPLGTSPAHRIEAATLMYHQIIGAARDRLWIASPYFVPDEGIANALQLAALRGVDVRIILPDKPDHRMVYLASFSFLEAMIAAGVKIFRFQDGFHHQKVLLLDDYLSIVGTSNLDNRSFRLNFELNIVVSDSGFAGKVAAMLQADLDHSRQVLETDYTERSFPFRLAVRFARLLSPIL